MTENFDEEGLDNGSEIDDNVTIESILSDIYTKIDQLDNLKNAAIDKAYELGLEITGLKGKKKESEKNSKRAGSIANKLRNLVS